MDNIDSRILAVLGGAKVSTPDLAAALGEDSHRVYRCCRRLEEVGKLTSELQQGPRLLYCVDCGKVVTRLDYPECADHDLRSFPRQSRVWKTDTGAGEPAVGRGLRADAKN